MRNYLQVGISEEEFLTDLLERAANKTESTGNELHWIEITPGDNDLLKMLTLWVIYDIIICIPSIVSCTIIDFSLESNVNYTLLANFSRDIVCF